MNEWQAGRQPGWACLDRLASNESACFRTPNEPLDEVVSSENAFEHTGIRVDQQAPGKNTYEYENKSIWPNMTCDAYGIHAPK